MADIRPLRAWRYNLDHSGPIDALTSPLFDVVSEKQREKLYQNPLNSIHLSVPEGDQPFEHARDIFNDWVSKGILKQDELEGIYPYYQYFSFPGYPKDFCRKGFICLIKAYDWSEGKIFRHENTIPQAVNDRVELLATTKLNVSPTHGVYMDPDFGIEPLLDEAISAPLYETEDYQGVRDVLSVIHDNKAIERIKKYIKGKPIILADGHHRYESSLVFRKRMTKNNPDHHGEELYNYHLMYLTNGASDDLRIFPTHRLIHNLEGFDPDLVLKELEKDFHIRELEDPFDIEKIILGKKHAFGLVFKDRYFKVRLKEDLAMANPWKFPEEIKNLDLTILHYFIIEKALGIPGKIQRKDTHVSYERNFSNCIETVFSGKAQLALITKEIQMEQVLQVCKSGYTLPQKSTYFYPKAICGFLFCSVAEER